MPKTKTKKEKGLTMTEAKLECKRLGIKVCEEYDKRFKNTWLYTLGDKTVEPVLRNKIVHKPKKAKKKFTWDELIGAAKS